MSKIFILIDRHSRSCLNEDFSNKDIHNLENFIVVNSVLECVGKGIDVYSTLLVFSPSILYSDILPAIKVVISIYGCKTIIATDDIRIKDQSSDTSIGYVECSLTDLTRDDLDRMVLTETESIAKPKEVLDVNMVLAKALLDSGENSSLHELLYEYVNYKSEMFKKNKELESMRERLALLESSNEGLKDSNKSLQLTLSRMIKKSVEVNNALIEYEVILSNDIFSKLLLSDYNNAPNILYLKFHYHLNNMEQLIETLVNTIYEQEKMSVKVLRVYDSLGSKSMLALPDYYHKLGTVYNGNELLNNKYLCKYGDYTNVLNNLLTNKSSLSYLIIVDCRCYSDTIVDGIFPIYNLCGDSSVMSKLGLQKDNTIFNTLNKDELLGWEYYPEYNKLQGESDKFTFISSRKCINTIISSLRNNNRKVKS